MHHWRVNRESFYKEVTFQLRPEGRKNNPVVHSKERTSQIMKTANTKSQRQELALCV